MIMMEVLNFIGRYYFVLALLGFNLWFAGLCFSFMKAGRKAKAAGRRKETVKAKREIAQYRAYVRYVGDLTLHNQAALRNRPATYEKLRKVA